MAAKVSKDKREQYLEDRRADILQAAISVFSQKGFEGANVADIAAEAKIAKGTIYLYFKSKDEIFRAILEDFSFLPHLMDILQDREAPVEETLGRLARRYMDFMGEQMAIIRIVLLEGGRFLDEPSEVYTQSALKGNMELASYFQEQLEMGRLRETVNPFLTARAFMGLMMTHLMLQEGIGGKHVTSVSEEAWIREIVNLVIAGIKA